MFKTNSTKWDCLKTEDIASLHVCQWQSHKKVLLLYLLWRWICALICLAAFVWSYYDVRYNVREVSEEHHDKWWIYLTSWTVLCVVVQAWMAALICTKALMDNNRNFAFEQQTRVGMVQQFYWILYSVSTVFSFFITFCYWTAKSYNFEFLEELNLNEQETIAKVMFIDLLLVGHPVRIIPDVFCSIAFGVGYSISSWMYFRAGGTNQQFSHAIYPILDWEKPEKAILGCLAAISVVVVVHILVVCFCKIRFLVHKNFISKFYPEVEHPEISAKDFRRNRRNDSVKGVISDPSTDHAQCYVISFL